ncbi:MAG: bifunctional (p)ppGpp synthetase/guanosine-3',5'-bis(diphosphate) 3'-pyrophosphohydrolase [Lachnospiraceae bacterium]|nr:bifunctional (p)ppGpp synthetase/guanosine-3',5'-bis(diphosphate) 3'-pyrophosphohydrolase [Lachnospiraceae bacterium]
MSDTATLPHSTLKNDLSTPSDFTPPEELYEQLKETVLRYHPSDDLKLIEKAYNVASEAHKDQKRKSGEPYIIHPICVGIILAELELDKETIAAGLLHDVVEDTAMTTEEISKEFSPEIALLVDGVTKLTQLDLSQDKIEIQAENLRKMFLAMAKDIRVILIKLADRLHNLRTLQYQPPAKQIEKSLETMDIYAPLAHRLGISKIKIELDDLCMQYLYPDVYKELKEEVRNRVAAGEDFINSMVEEVKQYMKEADIEAEVDGRVKHMFSIYKKMVTQGKTIDEIYDIHAIRIKVETVRDCYAALGIIHEKFKPIPGRFKDYIAMPKSNMYQSLHTTLIGPEGKPFEIQIRTFEMHRTAEYGIAAHWKYKEGVGGKDREEEKLSWLRQILEWQTDTTDNKEFVGAVKTDLNLFSDQVYVFTPAGDVKNLPTGSTPIDFAYNIHTAVGNKMIGARVNGRQVPIETELHNGDRVEIITSQNSKGPSLDWLNYVKSSQAKTKINQWFRLENKDDNIQKGKDAIASYCKSKGIVLSDLLKPEYMDKVLKKYNFLTWDALLASVGHGGLKEGQIVNRLNEEYKNELARKVTEEDIVEKINTPGRSAKNNKAGIIVKGIDDVAVRFSKCCAPVPGDEIVGYITRGRGISIHRTDCINILCMDEFDRERLIEAEWSEEQSQSSNVYSAEINIYAAERQGLVFALTKIFNEENINLTGMNVRVSKQGKATISVKFDIHSKEQLMKIISKIRNIDGVIDIERTTG